MKLASVLSLAMFSVLAFSQDLGTKADLVVKSPPSSPAVSGWDMVQMIVALGIVFALLKWALPKLVNKINRRVVTKDGSSISVEESASFGGGSLQIVTARGRTLLLCVSQSGVSCLADLTQESPTQEPTAFFEMVDKAVVEVDDKDQVAFERLSRLTG
jgi:flagellar biogenesis protein FliO